ncbi:MAG: DUF192 domain-containing protein [Polyangiaceae bacterium]
MRIALVFVLVAAAACERTPAEDFASRPSSPVSTIRVAESATIPAGRCVRATPPELPPPVPPGPAAGCPADPERSDTAGAPRPTFRVAVREAGAAGVDAEFVRSPHDTARGLMYRTSLREDSGMLFDLGLRDDHKFWMHNTCIPLDLIYVDEDGLVVGIVENAPTLNDDARGVGCPSRYVLEVNAGWSRRHGVKAGQHMSIPAEVTGK